MLCACCRKVAQDVLEANGLIVETIDQGRVVAFIDQSTFDRHTLDRQLAVYELGLLVSNEELIVEDIKHAVVDLIHRMNNVNSIVRKSDYLVEKLGMSYQKLSRLFSKLEGITLEKYIIQNKVTRIKELLNQGEFSLSEIAYMMDYSSVHYLSKQIKDVTGETVTQFKEKYAPLF
jgi:AraC-like DNA-binding protein